MQKMFTGILAGRNKNYEYVRKPETYTLYRGRETRDCEECYPVEEAGDGGEEVGVQSDSDAEGGKESGEAEASRKVLQPRAPMAEERRIHGLTHCPYRSWCEHCVRGQRAEYPHRSVVGPTGESTVTRLIMDCCYFTEGERRKEDDNTES